ncbi:MAG: 1-acyl-sn-glycerol-3-phosphate acyltransferase [Bacteriovorax sp.]|nr:1-acyl-sn-glycerol-3-phosphate acyltransferase [Bacteriovorax sp.]
MTNVLEKRSTVLIKTLKFALWPMLKHLFQLKIEGLENIPTIAPLLFVSNHNIGALIESHSSLFILQGKLGPNSTIYGFTHPSIFKVPGIKHYFEWIGAVPATYEVADDIFKKGHSLMIFPGGNRQALRSIWNFRDNHFRWSHGWAKIALEHNVPVIPITFKGSHFVNPVLLSGEWVSKILVLPWVLGVKWTSISIGQILSALLSFYLLKSVGAPLFLNIAITYLIFVLTPLSIVFPCPIKMKIHAPLTPKDFQDQASFEEAVAKIMDNIYSKS